jgi:type IV pilus assembly protein PilM
MPNFFSSITNLFSKPSQSVLGVDIGSSSIKVVQLRRQGGRAILETYGELSLGPYAGVGVGQATNLPPEKIIEAMTDLLGEQEVAVTSRLCGVAIPFSASFMQVVDLPQVPIKQLAQIIPIEARKYVPAPISEVMLDWSVIPQDRNFETDVAERSDLAKKNEPAKMEVLLVAIHNSTIEKYKEIVDKSGLVSSFFEIEIFSTMRAVLDQEVLPVMILDMGAMSTKLYIVERGILRSSHTIGHGSQEVTNSISRTLGIPPQDAEILKRKNGLGAATAGVAGAVGLADIVSVTFDYIFSEANQVVLSYQKKYNKNVSKVFLVGGGSALLGLEEVAKKSFQTDVEAGNPFNKVVVPAFLEDVLRTTGPEFTVAVGLALRKLQEVE